MHILIISDPIAPPSYAPRVVSTYHYLLAAGHTCVLESGTLPSITNPRKRIEHFLLDKLFRTDDRKFGKRLYRQYSSQQFDCILCSTYYYFPLWTARYLSQQWHIPLVVDLRDIAEQWGSVPYFTTPLPHLMGLEKILSHWYEQRNLHFRNNVLNQAQAVVSVSPWHCEWLRTQTNSPVHLIYNGFDSNEIHFTPTPTPLFRIAFVGRLISIQLRQPHMLLQAIGELDREGKISPDTVSLEFYSEKSMQPTIIDMATSFGAQAYICWKDYISRTQLCDTLAQSSLLVALGCPPSKGQHGILGTKVFEAIGAEKPLLLVPSDEDSLAELIKDTGIGLAAQNVGEIKTFLMEKYQEWQQNGYTHQCIAHKDKFNRQNLAHEFEDLLCHSAHL